MKGNPGAARPPGRWVCVEIPSLDYPEAWNLQLGLAEARHREEIPDVVLLLEHPPVFTLGRRGGRDHLKVSEGFLNQRGMPIYQVERGGEITYHGPGQLVGYPIVDLRANGWKVVDFVGALEEVLIRTVQDWGIGAGRNPMNRGVWVGSAKLASLGIAVRRGISFHGFALNVNTDLEPFGWINPCGLAGIAMTSMEVLAGEALPMNAVRGAVRSHLASVFGVQLVMRGLQAHLQLLGRSGKPVEGAP